MKLSMNEVMSRFPNNTPLLLFAAFDGRGSMVAGQSCKRRIALM